MFHQSFDARCYFTEIAIQILKDRLKSDRSGQSNAIIYICIEFIVFSIHDHFFKFLGDAWHLAKINPIIFDTDQLVNHRLIGPLESSDDRHLFVFSLSFVRSRRSYLIQQRSDRIFPSINNQNNCLIDRVVAGRHEICLSSQRILSKGNKPCTSGSCWALTDNRSARSRAMSEDFW